MEYKGMEYKEVLDEEIIRLMRINAQLEKEEPEQVRRNIETLLRTIHSIHSVDFEPDH